MMEDKDRGVSPLDVPPAYVPLDQDTNPPVHIPKIAPRPKTMEHYGIVFRILPKINGKLDESDKAKWKAGLYVYTKDVPQLMREGFYWTASNVVLEEGFFGPNKVDRNLYQEGWTFGRHYFLSDLSKEPRWTAWLIVFARNFDQCLSSMRRFSLDKLSPDLVSESFALNAHQGLIYGYCFNEPELNFNCIYGNMPMNGWWPWPKGESELATQAPTSNDGGTGERGIVQRLEAPTILAQKFVNSLLEGVRKSTNG